VSASIEVVATFDVVNKFQNCMKLKMSVNIGVTSLGYGAWGRIPHVTG